LATSLRSHPVAAALAAIGAATLGIGLLTDPARTWPNVLLSGFYVLTLAISATFFLATQRLTGARWSASLRRIPEAFMLTLPVAAALMLLLFFGRETVFPWTHPGFFAHDSAIAGRVVYLKAPFVFLRMGLVLAAWGLFAWLFRRSSLQQDRAPGLSLALHHRLNKYAAAFVLVFAISFTLGAYDWLISLDPRWFSTMFAVYAFAGTFVQGIAAVTLAAIILRQRNLLRGAISQRQLHDLGIMLFAFTVFWMYIWTCQYLLIWYGNIPEEVTHYVVRTNGGWLPLFALNPILNWVVPFVGLMSVRAKRNPLILGGVCVVLLLGHWLDLYLLILPALWPAPRLGLPEIFIAAGCMAAAYLVFIRRLASAPLVPVNDPILAADVAADRLRPGHAHS
jgi:hypothetical protein